MGSESAFIADTAHSLIYMSTSGASYPFNSSGNLIIQPRTSSSRDIVLATGSTTPSARLVVNRDGNIGVGTNSFGSNAAGVMSLANASEPTAGASDASMLYAKDVSDKSEMFVMNEDGDATQISPHDPETGEWEFFSKNVKTGKVYRVKMEKMMNAVQALLRANGDTTQYIEEYFEK